MDAARVIGGRYRTIRELGRGGMGVVYLVEHVHTGDQLALKVLLGQAALDPGAVERFKREARASARIKSEYVVKVIDADVAPELDGAPFLVMELLDGSDFQKLSDTRGRVPPGEVAQLLTQAARGLDKAHAAGIVHRDLKLENLFLHRREDGTTIVKIVDFGISKMLGASGAEGMAGAHMTQTGAVMGTPLYMAPEQARGRISEIGPHTDVWAMGLIALHLMTAEIYWRAETIAELMAQLLAEPLYPPSTRWPWLPAGFDAWFARSCAREPSQRFPRIGEQVEALASLLRFGNSTQRLDAAVAPESRPASVPSFAVRPVGANTTTSPTSSAAPSPARSLADSAARPTSHGGWIASVVAAVVLSSAGAAAWKYAPRHKTTTAGTPSATAFEGVPVVAETVAAKPPPEPLTALPDAAAPVAASSRSDAGGVARPTPFSAARKDGGKSAPVATPAPPNRYDPNSL